jgi:NADH-quinone oxidoreductase subunit G
LQDGDLVVVKQDAGSAMLTARTDDRVPVGCVRVAAANALTTGLGDLMGIITVEKAPIENTATIERSSA